MSHIVVTGANGFVGGALARRLQDSGHRLTLIDRDFDAAPAPGARQLRGSFGDPALLDAALDTPADTVFHLASMPGSLAEREYAAGYQVNLLATLALAQRLAAHKDGARRTRLVFASSVAVYGPLDADAVHEHQPPQPAISYGAHKLMTEIALADLSRRGLLDAVSLRLPGIVARPASESGHGSAFMSLVMRRLAAGEAYVCPVSAAATAWWMSLPCCVDNLLHAAAMDTAGAPPSRTWQLPVLHLSMEQVLAALAARYGDACRDLIRHQPDAAIEALFGRYPALHTPAALAAGFRHDGSAAELVRRALAEAVICS
ncbi:NAD-dependent epimerase/dehydratase family protein [Duganella sp. FT50W]|uniref:NAD-dependent epimerase/dehydratase family protein n=1 Tax=Duganella lactea TaxID=2692173 RepID=A0A6L8MG42_9BURK|nr:NAD-dependent epimerase/dehydratase family protein [Duganella lactea]MYM81863.1 NAD-dependent epimerase/dehydratase family protein [Duganella lactea]